MWAPPAGRAVGSDGFVAAGADPRTREVSAGTLSAWAGDQVYFLPFSAAVFAPASCAAERGAQAVPLRNWRRVTQGLSFHVGKRGIIIVPTSSEHRES